MLILTRRPTQALWIGEHIKLVVLDVSSGQVRIGIEAPKDVTILREEVYNRIPREEK